MIAFYQSTMRPGFQSGFGEKTYIEMVKRLPRETGPSRATLKNDFWFFFLFGPSRITAHTRQARRSSRHAETDRSRGEEKDVNEENRAKWRKSAYKKTIRRSRMKGELRVLLRLGDRSYKLAPWATVSARRRRLPLPSFTRLTSVCGGGRCAPCLWGCWSTTLLLLELMRKENVSFHFILPAFSWFFCPSFLFFFLVVCVCSLWRPHSLPIHKNSLLLTKK